MKKIKEILTMPDRYPVISLTILFMILLALLYSIGGVDVMLQVITIAISGVCIVGVLLTPLGMLYRVPIDYTSWIKNINWDFYLKSNGDLKQLSYILRPFGVVSILSLMILGVMIWQGFDTKIFFSRQLLDDVHMQGSKLFVPMPIELDEYKPLNMCLFMILLAILKWYWFLLKTPKKKEELIFSSRFFLEDVWPIPKIFILHCFIFFVVMLEFLIRMKNKNMNISKIVFEDKLGLDDSIRIRFLDTVFVFMDIFMWSFVVFCVVSLLVYIVKTFNSYLPQEQDSEFQNDVKKLRKLHLTRGYDLNNLSRIYITKGIDVDFVKIMKDEEKQRLLKDKEERRKEYTAVNVIRDTIAWLVKEPDINVYPRVVDLLYMVGFTLSTLLLKYGIWVIVFWLLSGRMEVPLYVLFICIVEHFVFVDVQMWYYMRYFRDHNDGRFELLKHVNINENIHTFYDR